MAPGCTRIQSEELEFFCKVLLDNVLSSSTFRRYSKGPAAVYVQNHNLMLPRYAFVTHRIRRPKQAVVAGTPGLQGTALGIVFAIFTRLHRVKIALCNAQSCCRKLRYIECVPQAKEFPTHQHVNHFFVKWANVWLLHKQLIQMLVHGCVGRSETQTIDEGGEGQVCPCWCVQAGSSLPCQHGQSCWKVLLMKFMRG